MLPFVIPNCLRQSLCFGIEEWDKVWWTKRTLTTLSLGGACVIIKKYTSMTQMHIVVTGVFCHTHQWHQLIHSIKWHRSLVCKTGQVNIDRSKNAPFTRWCCITSHILYYHSQTGNFFYLVTTDHFCKRSHENDTTLCLKCHCVIITIQTSMAWMHQIVTSVFCHSYQWQQPACLKKWHRSLV